MAAYGGLQGMETIVCTFVEASGIGIDGA